MNNKDYIKYTIDALIHELQLLIDLEIEEASKIKRYENLELNEVPAIDVYVTIIKLLTQIKNKKNESI
jgi:AMMECR1 domain-containing protein